MRVHEGFADTGIRVKCRRAREGIEHSSMVEFLECMRRGRSLFTADAFSKFLSTRVHHPLDIQTSLFLPSLFHSYFKAVSQVILDLAV